MPKKKERMAGYIGESDPSLADSATIDSAAKAVREYGQREGYSYNTTDHEYKEAISAYQVPYMQRKRLLDALAAAKRKEFDVFVVTEIRALSRRQVEVFVIYDMLQKYGVRLETIQEKFEDSALGRYILATRAMIAEVERENTYMRTQRGKRDRVNNGNLPGHPKPAYGYVFVDTEKETNARYEVDDTVIYVDATGEEWTKVKVVRFMYDMILRGESIHGLTKLLNELGIPTPQKARKLSEAYWHTATVYNILTDRKYIGEAYVMKKKRNGGKLVERPEEEWVRLPDGCIPPIICREVFDKVQEQLEMNKQDSLRNNKHPTELGILRAGYVFCGICGRRLTVRYRPETDIKRKSCYICQTKTGKDGLRHNHTCTISVDILDAAVWEKALEIIQDPSLIRTRIAELREANKPTVDKSHIEPMIADIRRQMQNLYALAQAATDNETIENLTGLMHQLEKRKHDAEVLLYDIAEEDEDKAVIEQELLRFESWADRMRSCLLDPEYAPTYEEKRLAVRIIGLKATVFPSSGYPSRYQISVTPPAIVSHMTDREWWYG